MRALDELQAAGVIDKRKNEVRYDTFYWVDVVDKQYLLSLEAKFDPTAVSGHSDTSPTPVSGHSDTSPEQDTKDSKSSGHSDTSSGHSDTSPESSGHSDTSSGQNATSKGSKDVKTLKGLTCPNGVPDGTLSALPEKTSAVYVNGNGHVNVNGNGAGGHSQAQSTAPPPVADPPPVECTKCHSTEFEKALQHPVCRDEIACKKRKQEYGKAQLQEQIRLEALEEQERQARRAAAAAAE